MHWLLGWLAGLPLWINLSAPRPYEPIKIFLFEAGIAAALVVAISRMRRRGLLAEVDRISAKAHVLDAAVTLFVTALAVSTVTSVDPAQSFWGSNERLTGLVFYWHCLLLYVIVRFNATREDWRFFSRGCLLAAALVSAYGILQWFGIDAPGLERAFPVFGRSGPGRAFATLGHPNFLGAYLAMVAPLVLWIALDKRSRWWRRAALLTLPAMLAATALTYSRGAWIAFVGGLVVFACLARRRSRRWYALGAGGFVIAAVVAVGCLIAIKPKLLASSNSFLFRLGTVVDWERGSNLVRIRDWSYLLSLMPARPLTGYGLDTYMDFAAGRHKDENEKSRDIDYPDPSVADRAHNVFLDVLWAGGVLALAAFVAVIIAAARRLRGLFAADRDRRFQAAVAAGLAAYLIGNLLSFDFSVSAVYAFLFLAAAGYTGET
ncbi:O-antigen ligase family protein [Candidatus Uhrbacteria bacterium]|nr:O-antigen ligase family protein [Candidatus Uhrbacteria bacterium]